MKINWIAFLLILAVAIMWQLAFKILGLDALAGFVSSFLICFILAVSLEVVKIK